MADESPLLTLETGRGELKLYDVGPDGAVPLVEVEIDDPVGGGYGGRLRLCVEQAEQAAAALAEWAHVARAQVEQIVGVSRRPAAVHAQATYRDGYAHAIEDALRLTSETAAEGKSPGAVMRVILKLLAVRDGIPRATVPRRIKR